MALDGVITIAWMIQVVILVIIFVWMTYRHRWFAASGIIVGVVIAFLPISIGSADAELVFFIAYTSVVALVVAYGMAKKWIQLGITLAVLIVSVGYAWLDRAPSSNGLSEALAAFGLLSLLLAPITCALACREIMSWLGHYFANARAVA